MGYRWATQLLINKIEESSKAGSPLILEPCEVDILYEHLSYLENSVIALAVEDTDHG